MSWQILILICVLLTSISTLMQRVLLKDTSNKTLTYNIIFRLIGGITILIYSILSNNLNFEITNKRIFLNLFFAFIIYGFGNYYMFAALNFIEASKYAIIFSSRGIITLVASLLFLGEILNFNHWLGTVAILIGIILANSNNLKFSFKKGEIMTFLAAVCFGLAATNDRQALQYISIYPYLLFSFFAPTIVMILIDRKKIVINTASAFSSRKQSFNLILLSVFYGAGSIAFMSSLKIAPSSSQVIMVSLSTVILTVILSIIFLKEKNNLVKKIIGALLSFLGLMLLVR